MPPACRRPWTISANGSRPYPEPMHLSFLVAAYAVVWIGVVVYVASLSRRSRNLEREVEELRELLDRRGR